MIKKTITDSSAGQQGFTIIEVMIALVIFAIGVLGLAAMQIDFIQGNATARGFTEAANQASDKIEELAAVDYTDSDLNLAAAGSPHTETVGDYSLSWTVENPEIDATPGLSGDEGAYKHIQLTVNWNDRTTARSFTLDTMRVQAP